MTSTSNKKKRNRLAIRELLCFRIQSRELETHTLLRSKRLFLQFVVDGYTTIKSERLSFIRNNQSKLRVDKYDNLVQEISSTQEEGSTKGKRVVLPSTFIGGT